MAPAASKNIASESSSEVYICSSKDFMCSSSSEYSEFSIALTWKVLFVLDYFHQVPSIAAPQQCPERILSPGITPDMTTGRQGGKLISHHLHLPHHLLLRDHLHILPQLHVLIHLHQCHTMVHILRRVQPKRSYRMPGARHKFGIRTNQCTLWLLDQKLMGEPILFTSLGLNPKSAILTRSAQCHTQHAR